MTEMVPINAIEAGKPGRYSVGSCPISGLKKDSHGVKTTKAAFGGGLRIDDVFFAGASSENSDGFATPFFGECEPAPPLEDLPGGLEHISQVLGRILSKINPKMGVENA